MGFEARRGYLFRLIEALPIPPDNIPYDQILKFKEHRGDELMSLRQEIDQLYLEAKNAEDLEHIKAMHLNRINTAINDLKRVSTEEINSTQYSSLGFQFNPIGFASSGSYVYEFSGSMSLGVVASVLSCISWSPKDTLKVEESSYSESPYKYAFDSSNVLQFDTNNYYF